MSEIKYSYDFTCECGICHSCYRKMEVEIEVKWKCRIDDLWNDHCPHLLDKVIHKLTNLHIYDDSSDSEARGMVKETTNSVDT